MEKKGFVCNLLKKFAASEAGTVACSVYDGECLKEYTYAQLLNDILKVAGYFAARNLKKQHIAMLAPNSYESISALYGMIASGNVVAVINPALPMEILKDQCRMADVTIFCCDESQRGSLEQLAEDITCVTLDQFRDAQPMDLMDMHSTEPEDTIVLVGTSGTTGKSKIVEITSSNMQSSLDGSIEAASVPGMERDLQVLPLYHIGGVINTAFVFYHLRTLCIGRGVAYMFGDMPVLNPTHVPFVPSMMESVEKVFRKTSDPAARAKYVGNGLRRVCTVGAAPKLSTCQYLISQGIALETAYGMTETTGAVTWGELNEDNVGTIGKMYGNVQIRFQDGELQMKGAAVMKGYYKDPEETAKVIEDGWIHTGDVGYCDENGYYYITGRKKNVIILSNGENVNPEEIEAEFGKCPDILECMVYGSVKGICADIYAENQEKAEAYVQAYNENVPLYRRVYKVNYTASPLEKTANGKIKRKENVYV